MTKILISPRYGFGFFTNNEMRYPQCLTDPDIIKLVEENAEWTQIESTLKLKYPNGSWCCGYLEIEEVPDSCKFIIKNNDGFEHLRIGQRVCNGSSNLITIVDGKQKFSEFQQKLIDKLVFV